MCQGWNRYNGSRNCIEPGQNKLSKLKQMVTNIQREVETSGLDFAKKKKQVGWVQTDEQANTIFAERPLIYFSTLFDT